MVKNRAARQVVETEGLCVINCAAWSYAAPEKEVAVDLGQ